MDANFNFPDEFDDYHTCSLDFSKISGENPAPPDFPEGYAELLLLRCELVRPQWPYYNVNEAHVCFTFSNISGNVIHQNFELKNGKSPNLANFVSGMLEGMPTGVVDLCRLEGRHFQVIVSHFYTDWGKGHAKIALIRPLQK